MEVSGTLISCPLPSPLDNGVITFVHRCFHGEVMVQGPPHVVWREGMRCCEEMARSPDLLVPTGSLPRGPARVPSRAHPHFTGSGTYRTQVVRDSEAVSLPPAVSCPLIPAGIASFPYVGAGVHFISCVHTPCGHIQADHVVQPCALPGILRAVHDALCTAYPVW